jgi:hypothetical protein
VALTIAKELLKKAWNAIKAKVSKPNDATTPTTSHVVMSDTVTSKDSKGIRTTIMQMKESWMWKMSKPNIANATDHQTASEGQLSTEETSPVKHSEIKPIEEVKNEEIIV